jgi:uncharacterized membrane protein YphA (DoxX/SURF4 family)
MSTLAVNTDPHSQRGLRAALWAVQILLGTAFVFAGITKASTPVAELGKMISWTLVVPPPLVRFIGVSELLGGIGLVLPSLTRVQPRLTVWAAWGLALIQLLAFFFHLSRNEFQALPINLVLGGLASFVAWGRHAKAPIAPRA